ncbi:MAG: tRNA-binding protein [Planctomycetota bacterium]
MADALAGQHAVTIEDFARLDIRVGRVLEAAVLERARKPAYRLRIDLGPGLGERNSSAQITEAYSVDALAGRLVLCVVNLPPRRVAGFKSEVLTLGVYSDAGPVVLIAPDPHGPARPGDRLG